MFKYKKEMVIVFTYAIVGILLAFLKFNHCRLAYFDGKESISHACYSDIAAHYSIRFIDGLHHWPYIPVSSNSSTGSLNGFEYPILIGLIFWIFSFISPTGTNNWNAWTNFFVINATAISLIFIACTFTLYKMTKISYVKYFALAPAVAFSLFLNWDIWVVYPMLLAIYLFENEKRSISAIALGISIATKFFPVFLLLPILLIDLQHKRIREFVSYTSKVVFSWMIINLPAALINFEGWSYFYKFSFSRWLGDGSIYSIFAKVGMNFNIPMTVYYLLNLIIFSLLIGLLIKLKDRVTLSGSAYLTIFAFTIFGKVYSMQYIIWLTPLAVLSMSSIARKNLKKVKNAFIIWQFSEILFHFSYFLNLYWNGFGERNHGVSDLNYGLIATARYIAIVVFTKILVSELVKGKDKKKGKWVLSKSRS